jgi:methylmalonyl-CoA mutase N-terminal domain/subunit
MERGALEYFARIDDLGGVLAGIEAGFFQRELGDAAFHYQRQLESREKVVVGVNDFVTSAPSDIPVLKIDPEVELSQITGLKGMRTRREEGELSDALARLQSAAAESENVMPYVLDAVRAYATVGEISETMKYALGGYREPAFV